MKKSRWYILAVLILSITLPAWAVREGWGNGKILGEQFEKRCR